MPCNQKYIDVLEEYAVPSSPQESSAKNMEAAYFSQIYFRILKLTLISHVCKATSFVIDFIMLSASGLDSIGW
jgi:hypothetical protein